MQVPPERDINIAINGSSWWMLRTMNRPYKAILVSCSGGTCPVSSELTPVVKYLGWVDLDEECFHLSAWAIDICNRGIAAEGTPQIQVNPTKVSDHQSHPALQDMV